MRAAALLLLAAGLASCATPSASPRGPSPAGSPRLDVTSLDPCSLIDAEALAAELLQPVAPGVPAGEAAGGTAACRYALTEGAGSISIIIKREPASGAGGEAILESLGPRPGLEELHGVGDSAWFGYCPPCPSQATTTLTVIAAPLEFSLAFAGIAPSMAERLQAEALARLIVEELGL
jgi:hypothetical protein